MKKTILHPSHVALGAKMGAFAGYDMPLYYADGVLKEHEWTRSHAGLFDVSHMGQVIVTGAGACDFWHRVTPGAFDKIPDGRAKYSVLLNEQGGIIDDLIVTRLSAERFFAVLNAGCKDKDIVWMQSHLSGHADMARIDDRALLALQGPDAALALREALGIDTEDMPYMWMQTHGDIWVSRLGYTGEDGFEISLPQAQAKDAWDKLLAHPAVKPVGLAARDSLRLEMGYPLYGHDIDDTTSPVEAGLEWILAKEGRDYIGAPVISAHLQEGASRRRVGVRLLDKGIAREGAVIEDGNGRAIGILTSGGFSPSLKQSIGQGYVESSFARTGQKISVNIRGNAIAAEVADLPFLPAKTRSMKQKAA